MINGAKNKKIGWRVERRQGTGSDATHGVHQDTKSGHSPALLLAYRGTPGQERREQ